MTDGFKVAEVGDVEPGQMLMVEVKSCLLYTSDAADE